MFGVNMHIMPVSSLVLETSFEHIESADKQIFIHFSFSWFAIATQSLNAEYTNTHIHALINVEGLRALSFEHHRQL